MDNETKKLGDSVKYRLSDIKSSLSWHSVLLFLLLLSTCSNSPKSNYTLENKMRETNDLLREVRDELRKSNQNAGSIITNDHLREIKEELRKGKQEETVIEK